MEWIEALRRAIDFMEEHLLEEIELEDVAKEVYLSPFYFQKGFKLITGYTLGEYIRNRRLYLAALDMVKGQERVIDLAYKYGYDSPESFTKAFTRFHGMAPSKIKKQPYQMNVFQPLQVSISIQGGEKIDYRIEKMDAFEVIGIERSFKYETAFKEIPPFWDKCKKAYIGQCSNEIGDFSGEVYGVSIDEVGQGKTFNYLIATRYNQANQCADEMVSQGLQIRQIPAFTWAKFRCIGPMPEALQALNTKIFKEWLPAHPTYEIAASYNIEMYSQGNTCARDYKSEIWVPIKKKHTKCEQK